MKGGTSRDRIRPLLRQIPDARVTFDASGFGAAGVETILTSESGEGLEQAALTLQRQLRTVRGLADPRPATPPSGAELIVKPRQDEAARLGVSAQAIASAARVATVGDIDANVSKLDQGERRIPIRVRLPAEARDNLDVIRNLRLPTATGDQTTLGSVADVYFQAGPAQIDRTDRKRQITINADTTGDTQVGDAQNRVNALPIMKHLPPGHYHEIPYRCLLPVGIENLLVAGRCLSATFAAQAEGIDAKKIVRRLVEETDTEH